MENATKEAVLRSVQNLTFVLLAFLTPLKTVNRIKCMSLTCRLTQLPYINFYFFRKNLSYSSEEGVCLARKEKSEMRRLTLRLHIFHIRICTVEIKTFHHILTLIKLHRLFYGNNNYIYIYIRAQELTPIFTRHFKLVSFSTVCGECLILPSHHLRGLGASSDCLAGWGNTLRRV